MKKKDTITNVDGKKLRNYIFSTHKQAYRILNKDYSFEHVINPDEADFGILKYNNVNIFNSIDNFKLENCAIIENNAVLLEMYAHYYHFIVDVLGKFLYIDKYIPGITPYVFLFNHTDLETTKINNENRKSFRHNFSYLAFTDSILESIKEKFPNITVLQQTTSSTPYIFKNLYTIDPQSVAKSDIKIKDHGKTAGSPLTNGLHHYKTIFDLLRETFLPNRESENNKNIFISRDSSYNRTSVNLNDLEVFMVNRGYEVVYPERLSFKEQIEKFYDAKNIVAISGSSLTNTIWANKDVNIVCIPSQFNYSASEWRMIAYFLNLNYLEFFIDPERMDLIIENLSRLEYLWD
jgi:hypothetical protein